MAFVHVVRPRYAEVDMQGVVFNAHWLTFFDEACTRYFGHLGDEASVDDRAVCVGVITYVSVTPGTHDSTPIPDELRVRLAAELVEGQ